MALFFEDAAVADDASRLRHAGRLLLGPSATWWSGERARSAIDPLKIASWAQFELALRSRYEPVNAALWARAQLAALVDKGMTSVPAYTEHFLEINAALDDMAEPDRVFNYLRGLPPAAHQTLATKRLVTLAEATQVALRYDAARMPASAPSRDINPFRQQQRGSSRLNAVDNGGDESVSSSESSDPTSLLVAQLSRMEARLQALTKQQAAKPKQRQSEGRMNLNPGHTPGLAPELARARIAARLCIHCGQAGHMKFECENAANVTAQPGN